MSDNAQEPTMEEILASIRRIISEDDAPASEEAKPGDPAPKPAAAAPEPEAAAPEAEAESQPAPEPEAPAEEVLELTERVEAETHGDIDVFTPPEPEPAPEPTTVAAGEPPPVPPQPEPEPFPMSATDTGLVGAAAAGAAASAFGQLSAAISMPGDGRTLEDVVRELLAPLLKGWLDENLPRIVDAAVRDEVERISRSRVR